MEGQNFEKLDYYINPNDLLEDEIDYELKLRCLPINESVQEKRQKLRHAQLEEIRKQKIFRVKKSIAQEYDTVKAKVQDIKHVIQFYPEQKLISRLRHYRLRTIRANAMTREQVRMKEELVNEIENLLDRYGSLIDRRCSQPPQNVQLHFSNIAERSVLQTSEPNDNVNVSGLSGMGQGMLYTVQTQNPASDTPFIGDLQLGNNLLDEAVGGNDLGESEGFEEHLDLLFEEFRETSTQQRVRTQEPLLPCRKEQDTSKILPKNQIDTLKQEINQYIQQALSEQMAALMEKLTPMVNNQRSSTPNFPPPPPATPPPHPMSPPPPPPNAPVRPHRGLVRNDYHPNSVASHVSLAGDFEPVQHNRPSFDSRNRWQVPISKWRINFSGDARGPTVTQFLNRVETLALNNRVTEAELLSQANFFFKEGSEAEEWYFTFCNKFGTWASFKHKLRLRFEQPNKDKVIERQILDRRQLPHETFVAFVSAIEKLAQQLTKPMPEERKLDIVTENMKDSYKPFLTLYRIERIDELVTICHQLDKSMYRSYNSYPKSRPHQINSLEDTEQGIDGQYDEQEEEELNAIGQAIRRRKVEERPRESTGAIPKVPKDDQVNILCWNCRQYGHFWRNCDKQKQIFCHLCGQMNFVTANCPNSHRFPAQTQENESPDRS